ncbi:MAG: hypothetical protein WAX89_07680 [Alphaproteobacteria bacterium]
MLVILTGLICLVAALLCLMFAAYMANLAWRIYHADPYYYELLSQCQLNNPEALRTAEVYNRAWIRHHMWVDAHGKTHTARLPTWQFIDAVLSGQPIRLYVSGF